MAQCLHETQLKSLRVETQPEFMLEPSATYLHKMNVSEQSCRNNVEAHKEHVTTPPPPLTKKVALHGPWHEATSVLRNFHSAPVSRSVRFHSTLASQGGKNHDNLAVPRALLHPAGVLTLFPFVSIQYDSIVLQIRLSQDPIVVKLTSLRSNQPGTGKRKQNRAMRSIVSHELRFRVTSSREESGSLGKCSSGQKFRVNRESDLFTVTGAGLQRSSWIHH